MSLFGLDCARLVALYLELEILTVCICFFALTVHFHLSCLEDGMTSSGLESFCIGHPLLLL